MLVTAAAVIAALALAGCGAGTPTGSTSDGNIITTTPYPNGPWSAGDQGTFMGSCGDQATDSYCVCALRYVMHQYPDTSNLPGSIDAGGMAAAQHQQDFPNCVAK